MFTNLNLQQAHQSTPPPSKPHLLYGLPQGEVGAIIGPGAVGKSFLALQLAYQLSSGQPTFLQWHSELASSTPVKVAYLSLEDATCALLQRCHELGKVLTAAQLTAVEANFTLWDAATTGFRLSSDKEATALAQQLTSLNIQLCIIDTFSAINPFDENSNSDMSRVIALLRKVARCTNCAILFIHHTNKNTDPSSGRQAARGASAITDNARWLLQLSPVTLHGTPSDTLIELAFAKLNYAPPRPTIQLQRLPSGLFQLIEQSPLHPSQTLLSKQSKSRQSK